MLIRILSVIKWPVLLALFIVILLVMLRKSVLFPLAKIRRVCLISVFFMMLREYMGTRWSMLSKWRSKIRRNFSKNKLLAFSGRFVTICYWMDNIQENFYNLLQSISSVNLTSTTDTTFSPTISDFHSREQNGNENITTPTIDFGKDKRHYKVHYVL